jgi:hypothetical protein
MQYKTALKGEGDSDYVPKTRRNAEDYLLPAGGPLVEPAAVARLRHQSMVIYFAAKIKSTRELKVEKPIFH